MNAATPSSWPTVIIGGAPRSGTSSLHDWLLSTGAFHRHPRKELFLLNDRKFWIQGATPGYAEVGARCYELAGFRAEDRFIDASTTYLYQDLAPQACARAISVNGSRPFIVVFCLREPAERLYSNFHYFRDVLLQIPAQTTFPAYVDSLFDRTCRTGNQQIDQALEHGLYPTYLSRWQAAIGADRIALLRTEELAVGPQDIAARIGARIGLTLVAAANERKNENYRPRYRGLQSFARRLGSRVPHGHLREMLKKAYVRIAPQAGLESRQREQQDALERVRSHYRAQVAAFSACGLGWYGPA